MGRAVKHIVILGGGTAGWLTASMLAARHRVNSPDGLKITLIESPETPIVGVGEGTWPTMRDTLRKIGLDENQFLSECDASFKQGSRFDAWVNGNIGDSYLHPFSPPMDGPIDEVLAAWKDSGTSQSFAEFVTPQAQICAQHLAPKQTAMPGYAGALNYAYHLDAVKLAQILCRHATEKLGVAHIVDHVTGVIGSENGDITSVTTKETGAISGDLFVDCSGHAAMLIGKYYGVEFIEHGGTLFNDSALAVQVPFDISSQKIASQTISTAHDAGWLWDIGLPTRRGVGCVYSSAHMDDDMAYQTLQNYLLNNDADVDFGALTVRKLTFQSGHRAKFWHRNCLAIGLSAGFLEPLEASAIVLIELSIEALIENFPVDRGVMDISSRRFNQLFLYRWGRIIDFLKLHYVLSKRQEPYWQDNRAAETIPERLGELLQLWRYQPPSQYDFPAAQEIFPAASYQYILYGMGFETQVNNIRVLSHHDEILHQRQLIEKRVRNYAAGLPTNNILIKTLCAAHEEKTRNSGKVVQNV